MANIVAKLVTTGAAVVASIIAKKTTDGTWKIVTGRNVPNNPDDPEVDLKEAIAFAVLSGALIALSRMLVNRQATRVLGKAQGKSSAQVANET
ncbi:DUF4235 domain-containing protein [Ornithinimicrobium tianjinense]|uniref:DUF4235 domain-containing protein n=1 Tax=Ornithinimicrobium tianjinense TaxID=1195761 RepID=A0A917BVN9_9MICO|nr:DUF4235 domain-containing protein [Ornithinimicrobium tianjinense]GGF58689.1 hypothetical protein GCM10011366_28150 [Ornithinimicrobium tianjinense]